MAGENDSEAEPKRIANAKAEKSRNEYIKRLY